jgi:hypothetical protein
MKPGLDLFSTGTLGLGAWVRSPDDLDFVSDHTNNENRTPNLINHTLMSVLQNAQSVFIFTRHDMNVYADEKCT